MPAVLEFLVLRVMGTPSVNDTFGLVLSRAEPAPDLAASGVGGA